MAQASKKNHIIDFFHKNYVVGNHSVENLTAKKYVLLKCVCALRPLFWPLWGSLVDLRPYPACEQFSFP